MSWSDLRNSLTVPRRSESISICGREPEVKAPTFLTFQELQNQEEKTRLLWGADRFSFKTKFSSVGLLFTMPPPTLFGFVEVDEGCYRLSYV